jgi:hypothetical protein
MGVVVGKESQPQRQPIRIRLIIAGQGEEEEITSLHSPELTRGADSAEEGGI